MDEKDFEHAERLMNAAIATALAKTQNNRPKPPPGWDGATCAECGDDVGETRARLGFWTCVDCQTLKERRQRLG